MKVLLHLVWVRFAEQPKKVLYLVVTLAVGVLAWVVVAAFSSPRLLSGVGGTANAILQIVNAQAVSSRFPLRYIPRIRQIPGVKRISWVQSGPRFYCGNTKEIISLSGRGGDVDNGLLEQGISAADLAAWHATENGVLVGPGIASRCGLTPGTTISPRNLTGKGNIPLQVIAMFPEGENWLENSIYAHYDYANRLMREDEQDKIFFAIAAVHDLTLIDQAARMIEQEFQSLDPPLEVTVVTETSILGRFGQVQSLLLLVTGAMALCVVLVFCSVLAHLTAQRRASMAMLQTLGFPAPLQFAALLLEFGVTMLLGTIIGIAAGYGVLALLTPWISEILLSSALQPVDGAILVLLPAIIALLAISLAWPAVQMARLRPVDYQHL